MSELQQVVDLLTEIRDLLAAAQPTGTDTTPDDVTLRHVTGD